MKSKRRDAMPLKISILLAVVMAVFALPFLAGQGNATISSPQLDYMLNGQTVNLTWNSVQNATEYRVYDSEDNSTWVFLVNTTDTYYVYNQPWNTTYYYYVVAVNATGNTSAPSNIVKVITPPEQSSGAGTTTSGFVIAVYTPFLWLGVFFVIVGILAIAYGKTSRKRKKWEGFGGLLLLLGLVIILAAVFLPTLHLL